ncbi:MADF domain-containing protein [Meloidogyne graminicola]|uniref:MADF domain-containing protein n=1 Tax=Meloidogyne graminicola TaxID=189291 RepID=A0A8T0A0X7_9BILA|nr:MADF domain-containing protein [Meloidogyne graminicola]
MSNWNDLSRERLIQEYKKHPCLWSSKDDDAKNVEKRRECLNLITMELNKYEERPFSQINPGAVIDEPGWVYFTRLKFLDDDSQIHTDFGPPTESQFPTALTPPLPPPKKKGKTTNGGISSTRTPDDSSLPTPLEAENNSIVIAIKHERTNNEIIPQKYEITQKIKNKNEVEQKNLNISSSVISSVESLQQQSPLDNNSECPKKGFYGRITFFEENTNNDEFSCFGRFIAATLRKISTRSQLDALEARKAIGDVLYGTELRSLQKQ